MRWLNAFAPTFNGALGNTSASGHRRKGKSPHNQFIDHAGKVYGGGLDLDQHQSPDVAMKAITTAQAMKTSNVLKLISSPWFQNAPVSHQIEPGAVFLPG